MRPLLTLLAAIAIAAPTAAHAGGDEHALDLRGAYTFASSHGGGASLGYMWGIDDYWNLTVDLGWATFPIETGNAPFQRVNLGVGVRYHLDAFQWIPWIGSELGGYLSFPDGGDPAPAFGITAGAGLDYRPQRSWSVGIWFRYHIIIVGSVPMHLGSGFKGSLYF